METLPVEMTIDEMLKLYLDSLNEKEQIAYQIAKSHLGSSFSLEKSNGFIEWKKEQQAAAKNKTQS